MAAVSAPEDPPLIRWSAPRLSWVLAHGPADCAADMNIDDMETPHSWSPPQSVSSPMLCSASGTLDPIKDIEEDSGSWVTWKPQSSSESGRRPGTTANEDSSDGRGLQSSVGHTGQHSFANPELRTEAPAAASHMGMNPTDKDHPEVVKSECKEVGEKKKVGRPIAFQGDINSPHLTDLERRRYMRRVTNRDSARRVRQKRQETMAELQIRMAGVEARHTAMASQLERAHVEKEELERQLACLQQRWNRAHPDSSLVRVEDSQGTPAAHERVGGTELPMSKVSGGKMTAPPASAAAPAVTSGQRHCLSTLSTGASGFRSGSVVYPSDAKYSRAVVSGVPGVLSGVPGAVVSGVPSDGNVCAPELQDLIPGQLAACPTQQPAGEASIPVPDICLSSALFPVNICNIISPFNHVAQMEPSPVTMPDLAPRATFDSMAQWQLSSDLLMWPVLSGGDPLELLFPSDELLEPITFELCGL